ncbi:hypothetical protein, partial [Mesotoga sp. B105.6.4]|uniref:hypothetical protein n=1 Tax=Mesotoga sp. B105.6.4 TaxID=1582224 RepID=UPI000CCF3280
EGILHCSYEYQYFIILLKEILNNGLINEKTNHRLQLLNDRIELSSLTELFKKHAGTSLSSVLLSRDLRQTEFSLVSLKNKIMLYIFAKRPLKTIFGRVRWIWKHIVLLLHPKGFKLVVLSEKKEMFQKTYIVLKQMFEYQLFNSLVLAEPNRERLPSSRSFRRIQSRISSVSDKARTRMIIEYFNVSKACNFEEGKLSCSGISSADTILLLVNELGSFGVNLHEKPILYLSTHASERELSLTICRLIEIMLRKFRKL